MRRSSVTERSVTRAGRATRFARCRGRSGCRPTRTRRRRPAGGPSPFSSGCHLGGRLARAYGMLSSLCRAAGDLEGTVAWGTRALELAQRLDDVETVVHALTNIAAAEFLAGVEGGRQKLERSLELAREAGLEERVAGAFCYPRSRRRRVTRAHALAESYARRGDRVLRRARPGRLATVSDRGACGGGARSGALGRGRRVRGPGSRRPRPRPRPALARS